jgi:transcriptional regulator with XRE-family HTH domain
MLSELLRSHRQSAGLTLEALSEVSKISARTISDIERGVSISPQGRTVEALAAALGLKPAQHDEFLLAARSRGRSRGRALRASAGTPHRILDFAGRGAEIAEVTAYLEVAADRPEWTAVLLTGAPGIGKSASAMEALDRPHKGPAEIVFVDLDGFSAGPLTPLQVLQAVLRQMPGIGDKAPADLDEAGRLWRAASAENPRSVVLDNAAVEQQVRPVMAADPRSKVIITSRRSLAGLEGVKRVTLGPLSEQDSMHLLERLIPEGQRRSGDLVELARLCDCIPLALRIVGNRIASRPAWQAAEFAERMRSTENRLRLLVAGDLAVEAAFALSYKALDPSTAQLFRSISVIDGATFDARIAAATAGIDVVDADELLEELTDLGLVEARGGSRYRVHDLVRLYAAARLEAEDPGPGSGAERDRLRGWLLASLERAGAWFEPDRVPETHRQTGAAFADSATAQAWIRQEEPHWWPALKSAARLGEHDTVVDVADSLHWFSEVWIEWGHWRELFALAVASAQALGDKRLEAMHLGYLVWSTIVETGDTAEGMRLAKLAVAAATLSGDRTQLGWAKFYAGWMYQRAGLTAESTVLALESIAEFETVGNYDGAAQPMTLIARLQTDRAGHERVIVALQQIVARMDETKVEKRAALTITTLLAAYKYLSASLLAVDRPLEALEASSYAVNIAEEFGAGVRMAGALRFRAVVQLALEDFDAADRDIAHALTHLDPESTNAVVAREKEALAYLSQQSVERISRPENELPL